MNAKIPAWTGIVVPVLVIVGMAWVGLGTQGIKDVANGLTQSQDQQFPVDVKALAKSKSANHAVAPSAAIGL